MSVSHLKSSSGKAWLNRIAGAPKRILQWILPREPGEAGVNLSHPLQVIRVTLTLHQNAAPVGSLDAGLRNRSEHFDINLISESPDITS